MILVVKLVNIFKGQIKSSRLCGSSFSSPVWEDFVARLGFLALTWVANHKPRFKKVARGKNMKSHEMREAF